MKTAVLIDGAFFLRCFRQAFPDRNHADPRIVAETAFAVAVEHLARAKRPKSSLYRIFFYDCPPIAKKMHHPVSGRAIDFAKTAEAIFRNELHAQLRKQRKVALRLGHLSDHVDWQLKPDSLRRLRRGELTWSDTNDDDYQLDVKQKAVDMKVGLDIASLAYKALVDQIVLIAGDADFVPAAKLARREGIDFILNPMGRVIAPDLHEHIDGLHQVKLKPIAEKVVAAAATTETGGG